MALDELQERVRDKEAFVTLEEYEDFTKEFLGFVASSCPTRIVSPTTTNYIFFQYGENYGHRISRPLNTDLFVQSSDGLETALVGFREALNVVEAEKENCREVLDRRGLQIGGIDRAVYTMQQSIGCVGDSFPDANQSRKRIGQLFENLVRLVIQEVGVECKPRTVQIPLPGYPDHRMSYELDLVFSRGRAIVASETEVILPDEIVGSVKTTSKDRIDKVFLDKFLLSRLLGRDIRVVAIFLHDVQRARKAGQAFGINSTFKSNHFLGYTLALNRLDGVYYVDPRPIMATERFVREIGSFSKFISSDLWML